VKSCFATISLAVCLFPAVVAAQPAAPRAERLSLDAAVKLAIENNRGLESARLQVKKAEEDVEVARTKRLPVFELNTFASQLLTPVDFSFPTGAFGDYPGIGPIPSADTVVSTPRRPNVFVSSQVSQPLTQLIRINLGIRGASAARELERERTREQEQAIANAVKRQYFAILQTSSALAASEEAIALYRELDRTLEVRVAQQVALKGDSLDVRYRLAQEELARTTRANTLASQKEQLNQLLGRDVRTAFEIDDAPAATALAIDLDAARTRALADRPDIREARLKVEQADIDRQLKKADRIPDVSLAVSYTSNFNMDVLPKNLAAAGVQVKWEPFDWGRRGRELAGKQHTLDQARLAVRDAEDRAVIDINTRYRKLDEARAALTVAGLAQGAVREKLRVKVNQFQLQAAMLADVLTLRADLAGIDDQYQQALLAFWTAKADFEHAVGEEGIR
jgi:outer membrane protein